MRLRSVAIPVAVSLSLLGAVTLATAQPPTAPARLDGTAFTVLSPAGGSAAPDPTDASIGPTIADAPIVADFPAGTFPVAPRPTPGQHATAGVVVIPPPPKPKPKPAPKPVVRSTPSAPKTQPAPKPSVSSGHVVKGQASWYCLTGVSACHHSYPGGLYAAAGPALRVGSWRERTVRVCGNGHCVFVRLIDWCGCPSTGRIIDLYSDAFKRLAPLSSGVLRVTVSW
jgi:Lytic transglycolase